MQADALSTLAILMASRRTRRPPGGLSSEQLAVEARLREVIPPRLQREREARGLTQEQLAERAGVHWTTVGKVERGKQIPSLALLAVLATALDLQLMDLLGGAIPDSRAKDKAADDPTVSFVLAMPAPERRRLLPVLEALQRWKANG